MRAISGPPQICLKATLETSRGHQGLLEDVSGPPWGHQGHFGATRATWGLPGPPGNHPRDTLGTRGPPQGHHGHLGYTSRPPQRLLGDVLGPLRGHGGRFGAGQLVELAFKMPPRDVRTHGDTVNANPRWEAASPDIFFASGHGGASVSARLEDFQNPTRWQKPFPRELRQQHEG